MSRQQVKTYMDSEERKDFLLESGFLLTSASESQTVSRWGRAGCYTHFKPKLHCKMHQAV